MRSPKARLALAACLSLAVLSACRQEAPVVGPKVTPVVIAPTGPQIEKITGASVDANHVVVVLRIVVNGAAATLDEALAAKPSFTLAALSNDPLSSDLLTGRLAWRSLLLTGAQTLTSLPIGGPGTPAEYVFAGTKQPGAETSGTLEPLGGGDFKYTYSNALPGYAPALPASYDPKETLRVGVFLGGVTRATPQTVATFDFVPAGGPVAERDTVLDANCNGCHGTLRAHAGTRTTVRLCLTCHTWQNADADTVDPAATTGATPATNPNPLELGRLVHRIHRGKNLPTLYKANSTLAAMALPSATPLPLPFNPSRTTGTTPKNAPVVTLSPVPPARFAVIGDQNEEFVFGKIGTRTDNDQPARTVPSGVNFPRDLRDCDACHANAPKKAVVIEELHRRTCQSCHPDVWFGDGTTASLDSPDPVHMPHPGGPQLDDSKCRDCHTSGGPTAYAPIDLVHVVPFKSPYYNQPSAEIVAVSGLQPGQKAVVFLRLSDKDGPILALNTTTTNAGATPSPIVRAITPSITLAGPTTDYLWTLSGTTTTSPISESLVAAWTAVPRTCTPGPADPTCLCTPVDPATTCVITSSPAWAAVPRRCTPGSADPTCVCTPVALATDCVSTSSPRMCTPGLPSDPDCTCTLYGTATTCSVPVDAPPLPAECTPLLPCYRHTFRTAVPAEATGTWGLAVEGRRSSPARTCTPGPADPSCVCTPTTLTTCSSTATKHYVVTTDMANTVKPELQFPWPYTGESLTEVMIDRITMSNPIAYIDTAVGTLGGGTPVPRRQIVDTQKCNRCHLRRLSHGARVNVQLCVMCHTPNRTDWSKRTKDPAPPGNVTLSKTFDGREEESVHFKVMIHRLHTGRHQGTASLDLILPYVVSGSSFFDDNQFPNDLANCTLCHAGDSYTLTAMPAGLEPTVANETGTIRHVGGAAHTADEKRTPPITAACMGCHATAYSLRHTTQYTTTADGEQCAQCHAKGQYAVKKVHGIPETTTP